MAKKTSKVAFVIITVALLVSCSVLPAFAYGEGGTRPPTETATYKQAVSTIPFTTSMFGYEALSENAIEHDRLYFNMPLLTSHRWGDNVYWGFNDVNRFASSITSATFEQRIRSLTQDSLTGAYMYIWDTSRIAYNEWGFGEDGQRVLPITMQAQEFWTTTDMYDKPKTYLPYFSYPENDWYQGEVVLKGQLVALVRTRVQNDTSDDYHYNVSTVRIPVEERYQSFGDRDQMLFFSQRAITDAVLGYVGLSPSQANTILDQQTFYWETFSVTFDIPQNDNDQYAYSIYQPFVDLSVADWYGGNNYLSYFVATSVAPFEEQLGYNDVRFGSVIANNVGDLLNTPIFREVTFGSIVLWGIGIGILFAVLKYFAGG